ncbi:septum formation inhibitor MinC, partial [Mesorhizobium sp. M7A.F.Ca.CA.002.14.1.2]
RGRASGGALGNRGAGIFCRKNEAGRRAVGGWYVTAEEMEGVSRGKPVQAFLDGDALRVSTLS